MSVDQLCIGTGKTAGRSKVRRGGSHEKGGLAQSLREGPWRQASEDMVIYIQVGEGSLQNQRVKCLLCKPNDPSSVPRNQVKDKTDTQNPRCDDKPFLCHMREGSQTDDRSF